LHSDEDKDEDNEEVVVQTGWQVEAGRQGGWQARRRAGKEAGRQGGGQARRRAGKEAGRQLKDKTGTQAQAPAQANRQAMHEKFPV
jgi:hypothetical protein